MKSKDEEPREKTAAVVKVKSEPKDEGDQPGALHGCTSGLRSPRRRSHKKSLLSPSK